MSGRIAIALFAAAVIALAVACGGGGGSSSPTPSAERTLTGTPDPQLGPAEAVVIFGSPDATERALKDSVDGGGPARFYLAGESRDEDSFDGAGLPGDATALGVSSASIESEEFDAAYEEASGRSAADFPGVREGYDGVYLAALAAAAANSTDFRAVRGHAIYVANSPGGIVNPGGEAFSAAVETLAGGGDVNYIGVSGQVDLTVDGEAAKGRVNVWRLLGERVIEQELRDVDLAAEIGADVPSGEADPAAEDPSGPLRIGAVLPLGSDEGVAVRDAMQMAADEINAAGGLFGADIELRFADDAGDAEQAVSAAQDLQGEGVSAIVGPLSAGGAVRMAATIDVLQVALTPSAALPLTEGGPVVRAIAGDVLQAPPLANLALEAEVEVVCVILEPGVANEALAIAFKEAFEHKGGAVRLIVEVRDDGVSEDALSLCLGA